LRQSLAFVCRVYRNVVFKIPAANKKATLNVAKGRAAGDPYPSSAPCQPFKSGGATSSIVGC
jgi:hypothetical protein